MKEIKAPIRAIYVGSSPYVQDDCIFLNYGMTGTWLPKQNVFVPDQENGTSRVSWLISHPDEYLYFPKG